LVNAPFLQFLHSRVGIGKVLKATKNSLHIPSLSPCGGMVFRYWLAAYHSIGLMHLSIYLCRACGTSRL
jgi:hypothetical protein